MDGTASTSIVVLGEPCSKSTSLLVSGGLRFGSGLRRGGLGLWIGRGGVVDGVGGRQVGGRSGGRLDLFIIGKFVGVDFVTEWEVFIIIILYEKIAYDWGRLQINNEGSE